MLIFDTNIWVSYALTPNGKVGACVKTALETHSFAFSEPSFTEVTEVLLRPKFDPYVSQDSRIAFLKKLASTAQWFSTEPLATACRDKDDNKFLDLARACEAEFLITGDQDLLVLNSYGNTRILTVKEFAKLL